MPQTALQICNSALIKIGGRPITAWAAVTTKEGELVYEKFTPCLNLMSRGHVWAFSKVITSLTTAVTTTVDSWSYIITLPSDCARILRVSVNDSDIEYERVGNTIYTQYATVDFRYVQNIATTLYIDHGSGPVIAAYLFPDDFAEALALYLAADICVSLTQNADMKAELLQQFSDVMRMARFNGACEVTNHALVADEWTNIHGGTYGNPYPTLLA